MSTNEQSNKSAPVASKEESADVGARAKILEVALDLFSANGFDGVSTRDIAQQSGLNVSLISYYFGGKEGLYKTVILTHAEMGGERINTLLSEFEQQNFTREVYYSMMRKLIYGMVKMKVENPKATKLFNREIMSGMNHSKDIFEKLLQSTALKVVDVFERAQKKGYIRKDINTAILFASMIHATDSYVVTNDCGLSFIKNCYLLPNKLEQYVDQVMKIFVQGVSYEG